MDVLQLEQDGVQRSDQRLPRSSTSTSFPHNQAIQLPLRSSTGGEQQQQRYVASLQQQAEPPQGFSSDSRSVTQLPSAQMSELDRFGLQGLLATLQNDGTDQANLVFGMDLNTLGLDLHRPECVLKLCM